jgi:hypothetical protein
MSPAGDVEACMPEEDLRRSKSVISATNDQTASKKYAVFGNIPLVKDGTTPGKCSRWDDVTDRLLGWSVESRG